MSTPYDATPRDSDTQPIAVLRRRLATMQAAYDSLLGDLLAAKNAYGQQRDGLREAIQELQEAIDLLTAAHDEEGKD